MRAAGLHPITFYAVSSLRCWLGRLAGVGKRCVWKRKSLIFAAVALAAIAGARAQRPPDSNGPSLIHQINSLSVPRLHAAPKLGDFEGMAPATDLAKQMLAVSDFVQR